MRWVSSAAFWRTLCWVIYPLGALVSPFAIIGAVTGVAFAALGTVGHWVRLMNKIPSK